MNNGLTCCFFSNFAANIEENDCENMMKTTIQEQDGNLVAVLEGRLDTAAAAVTEKELQPLYDCDGKNIIFDCSNLEFISSSGLCLRLPDSPAFLSLNRIQRSSPLFLSWWRLSASGQIFY